MKHLRLCMLHPHSMRSFRVNTTSKTPEASATVRPVRRASTSPGHRRDTCQLTRSYAGETMSYVARSSTPLKGTLTVRLPLRSLRLLRSRARAEKKSSSDVVRELLERDLKEDEPAQSAWDLTQRHVGAVKTGPVVGGARVRELLEKWNPDRRG